MLHCVIFWPLLQILKGWAVCLWSPLLPSSRDTPFSITAVLPERVIPHAALWNYPPGGSGGNLLCPWSLHLLQGWGNTCWCERVIRGWLFESSDQLIVSKTTAEAHWLTVENSDVFIHTYTCIYCLKNFLKINYGISWFNSKWCPPSGRPKGVKEQDVYICDYRLDKSAHLFYKIHRNRYPVCTKPYAFNHFPKRLAPKRDFSVSDGGLDRVNYWFINT